MAMQLELEHYIRKDTECPHCGTGYYYPHKIEVRRKFDPDVEGAEDKAREELKADYRSKAQSPSIVPCPACKKLSKEMHLENRSELFTFIFVLVLSLLAFAGVMWLVATIGLLFYVFAFFNVLLIGYCAFNIVAWPFGFLKQRIGVIPGEEQSASSAVQAKLQAIENPEF